MSAGVTIGVDRGARCHLHEIAVERRAREEVAAEALRALLRPVERIERNESVVLDLDPPRLHRVRHRPAETGALLDEIVAARSTSPKKRRRPKSKNQ